MKKSLFFIMAAVFFSFTACSDLFNMTIPKKVSVATDADFNVNLGTMKYNLSETLNTEGITKQMQDNLGDKMQAFVYIPDDNPATADDESDILSYLIHYPVYEVPLDLSSYINNLDFDGTFGGQFEALNCNQTIELPEVRGGDEVPVGLDFMNEFRSTLDANLASNAFSIGPVIEPNIAVELNTYQGTRNIEINGEAEKIVFKPGSAIVLKFRKTDPDDCSSNFIFTGHGFLSSDGTAEDLGTSGPDTEIQNGGEISIPLDRDEGLPSHYYICLSGQISGGTPTIYHSYDVSFALADGSDLLRVENILKTSAELGINPVEFDMSVDTSSMNGLFESAEIGSGHIEMSTSPISGWSGVDTEISFTFAGSDISGPRITDGPHAATTLFDKIADLSGTEIIPDGNPIDISGSVAIEVLGATIDFTTDISDLKITYDYEIETLQNVVVDLNSPNYSNMPKSVSLGTDINSPPYIKLDSALVNYVATVNFGEESSGDYYKHDTNGSLNVPAEGLGFRIKITNTLPTDDLIFHIHSDIFSFDMHKALTQNVVNATEDWVQYPELDFRSLDNSVDNFVDFDFILDSTTITLDEVTLGETYQFGLSFEKMVFDWDYITLKTVENAGGSGYGQTGQQSLDSFDLKSLLSGLSLDDASIQNVKINTLPVFFYAQKPVSENATLGNLLNNLNLRGSISIDYEHDDDLDESTPNVAASYAMLDNEVLAFMESSNIASWPSDTSTIIASADYAAAHSEDGKTYYSAVIPNITHVDGADHPYYSFDKDLADIINEYPENMVFNFYLSLSNSSGGEAKIYSAWIDDTYTTNNSITNINIDMAILLSFNLKLTGNITLDAMKYFDEEWNGTNADKDLLSRDSAEKFKEYADYCNAVNKFGMTYTVQNNLFKGLSIEAAMNDQASRLDKKITLYENKKNELNFNGLEIKNILTSYPFHPNVALSVLGGTESEPRYLTFSRSAIDSEDGGNISATVGVIMDLTDKEYIKVYGE